ncbi:MAG: glycosyltransferase [Nitrospirae bacterium]|nr:glycosyltransferase [Nitrospirota bacterium]
MKILIAGQYYYPYRSGLTEHMRMLAEGLVQRGHDVTVLTSQSSPDLPRDEKIAGVRVVRLPVWIRVNRGSFMPQFLTTLFRLRKSYDIINLHFPMPECLPAAFLLRNAGLVVTYHCDLTLQGNVIIRALEAIYFRLLFYGLRYPKAIVATSRDYAESSALRPFMEKVVPIIPPIKILNRKDPVNFKTRFGITGGPVIGFLGRVVFEKGLEDLVNAMGWITEAFPEAILVIAGEKEKAVGGTVTAKLLAAAERRSGRVLLTGFLEESLIEEFYSACDVFVLPSVDRLEAFGTVQVEAMLCGTPVVAADRPGMRMPIRLTGMGCLVPPRNPRALAEGMIAVLRNKERYVVERPRILEHFGIGKTIEAYEDLFRRWGKATS